MRKKIRTTVKSKGPNFKNNKDFFYLTKPDLKFINVKINYELINSSITNLNSGIYLF
jgi:hypothetical protein